VEEVELGGPGFEGEDEADYADDVDPFDDDEAEGDVPEFVFPGAGEEEHEEEPVHPLFEACAAGVYPYIDPLAVIGLKVYILGIEIDPVVDLEDVFEYPDALVE